MRERSRETTSKKHYASLSFFLTYKHIFLSLCDAHTHSSSFSRDKKEIRKRYARDKEKIKRERENYFALALSFFSVDFFSFSCAHSFPLSSSVSCVVSFPPLSPSQYSILSSLLSHEAATSACAYVREPLSVVSGWACSSSCSRERNAGGGIDEGKGVSEL